MTHEEDMDILINIIIILIVHPNWQYFLCTDNLTVGPSAAAAL